LVANHPGKLWADLMILPALWPNRRPVTVTYADPKKVKNKNTPKLMTWGSKVFPVIASGMRGNGTGLKATREILRSLAGGELVWLMLSGEVSWTGRINQPRPAVSWITLKSGVPVLPCAVIGTYDVWPRWQEKPNKTGKVTIRFGKPFRINDKQHKRIDDHMLFDVGQRIKSEIELLQKIGHSE
jgi:1-acyl-sn-glycerol-3-phosphate acyltransferase